MKRIEKVRIIPHGLFTDEKKGFAVAENGKAGRIQKQGVVEIGHSKVKINHQ